MGTIVCRYLFIALLIGRCSLALGQAPKLDVLINYYGKDKNVVAEKLIQSGWKFYGDDRRPSFQKGQGSELYSLDFVWIDAEWQASFSASPKYTSLVQSLETEVKAKAKKTKFFFSRWFKIYVTEYMYRDFYIYTGVGGIYETSDKKPMKFVIVSERDLKGEGFFQYEE